MQIAYGAVLVPNEPDTDGDILSAEKISEVAHGWLADYSNIDLQHSLNNVNARPVESYITQADTEVTIKGVKSVLPAGTWVMAVRIDDREVWKRVASGQLSGYSIMGVRRNAAMKSVDIGEASLKRTMLKDLGADWVCPFVSLVDEPAVPKAKFFAIKAAEQPPQESLLARLFGGVASKKKEADTQTGGDEMELEQVQEMVSKAVADALANAEAAKIEAANKAAEKQAELDAAREAAVKEMEAKIDEQAKAHEAAMKETADQIKSLTDKLATKSRKLVDDGSGDSANKGAEDFKPRFPRDEMGRRVYA